jgi:Tol biopolymer transport system component
VKLNDPLVDGGSVASHRISADSTRVVYLAEQDTAGLVELYSVPLTGGAAVKLNDPLVAGGNVGPFSISPDSTQVTYVADEDADDVTELELYSVPLIGGAAVRLHDRSTDGGDVLVLRSGIDRSWLGPRITSDSRRVVYMAGEYPEGDTDGMFELYSVPLTGGTPIKLNDPLAPGHGIWTFRVSPDSDLVVYLSGQVDEGALELYSVPVRGGAVFKLNGALVDGGFVGSNEISPDSSRVVYKAIQDQVQAPFGLFELYASTLQRPEHLIEALVETVIALNLRNGISNALDSKLQNVLSVLEDANANNDDAAINVLYAFIYNVEAQRGKALSDAEADSLIADAQAIIDLLSQ